MGLESTIALLLGATMATVVFMAASTAYVLYRYVYKPWLVVRADQAVLRETIAGIKAEMGSRKAITITPQVLAQQEREQRMRTLQSAMERGLEL